MKSSNKKSLKEQIENETVVERDTVMKQFSDFVEYNAKREFISSGIDIIKYYEKLYPNYSVTVSGSVNDNDLARVHLDLEFTNKKTKVITAFHITAHP